MNVSIKYFKKKITKVVNIVNIVRHTAIHNSDPEY